MTAEIAVLNRQAVALAADSAVTVQIDGHQKVYNSVNKLFMLSKHAPVGIMIYGSSELTEMPWETCIKAYRRSLGKKRFSTLKEYSDAFLAFIEGATSMFPADHQELQVRRAALITYGAIMRNFKSLVEKATTSAPITATQLAQFLQQSIEEESTRWTTAGRLPGRTDAYARTITSTWSALLDRLISEVFRNLPLSRVSRNKLKRLPGTMFTRSLFPDNASGIVIAGYGEEEYFPSMVSFDVEGVILSKLKYRLAAEHSVAVSNDACITPFAQGEMVYLFMEGIDPTYRAVITTAMDTFLSSLPDAVVSALPMTPARKAQTKRKLEALSTKVQSDFRDLLQQYATIHHVKPVVNSVAILPKEELAAMAESLVHLTSLKRRITMDTETVGGPIDVAVISKGDGFIWIKRKHYFDPKLNPHFLTNYYE